MSLAYREYAAHPELRSTVECCWTISLASGRGEFSRIVPDGSADIIINALTGSVEVVGTMTRAKVIPHFRAMELVAVRFLPGGASPFLGIDMHELTDAQARLDICEVLERDGVIESIARQCQPAARVGVLQDALRRWIRTAPAADSVVLAASERIAGAHGRVEVAHLAEDLGVTTRRLQRRFRRHVGIGPKQLARILRVRTVIRTVHRIRSAKPDSVPDPNWLALSLDAGFCDQAHLVHDFRRIAGVTPGAFLRE